MSEPNRTPEQIARDRIDRMLLDAGWSVQDKNQIDFGKAKGIAVQEYPTDNGPADYVLFVERRPISVIEAKRPEMGQNINVVAEQSAKYATVGLKWIKDKQPLPLLYESTGEITLFRDERDPKPRSREVFWFHQPQTLHEWMQQSQTLRARLQTLPLLGTDGLRKVQVEAITSLEKSFKAGRPRALIQMATGADKTFTAITSIYRLLQYANAKRILFLVDTKNLGEQAEQEFMAYLPNDDNRKFTELYNVQRLSSNYIADSSQVVISTIQRLYSILKGEPLDEAAELENPAEHRLTRKEPKPVVYNPQLPIEYLDFIVIDECHRSIYNLWQEVLDYFDAFLIGLTATLDKRTFAFFHENVVSEYTHEQAVADGVNVGYDVYTIETEITKQGAELKAKRFVPKRDKLTRKKCWELLDEDLDHSGKQLDRDVVNPSQIRKVIRTFREKLPAIFPGRKEVPKTLIFAKNDSRPLERKPSVSFKDLFMSVLMGADDEETLTSLANRLPSLNQQLDDKEREQIKAKAGKPLSQITRELLEAVDPDLIETQARKENNLPPYAEPDEEQRKKAAQTLAKQTTAVFNGELNEMLENIRRSHEQVIDNQNIDRLIRAEWDGNAMLDDVKGNSPMIRSEKFFAPTIDRSGFTHTEGDRD